MHTETNSLIFGDMSNRLAITTIVTFGWKKGEACKPENTVSTVKYEGGSIMLWGCFAAGGTDALHKIDDIMWKEFYGEIL